MKKMINAASKRSIWDAKIDTDDMEEEKFVEFVEKELLDLAEVAIRDVRFYEKLAAIYQRPEVTDLSSYMQALKSELYK